MPELSFTTVEEEVVVKSPQTLGRYRLHHRLASGGMASVYLARLHSAESFQKWVAVKLIHPHISSETRFVKMFFDEARIAARIDHPNVCTVFDFGEADGTYFIAMEYLHGEPLSAVIQRATALPSYPRREFVRMVADTARGLHAAHELRGDDGAPMGIVHRDVSPQNILVLHAGPSKIVDFGLAFTTDDRREQSVAGEVKGKLAYVAPEQLRGAAPDRRTDIFALGVVLWEATLGRRLFKRDTDTLTAMAALHDEVPLPSSHLRSRLWSRR